MNTKSLSWMLECPRRRGWIIAVGVGLLVTLGWGFWQWAVNPPAWIVRWKINRYLEKNGLSGDFQTDFAFPSPSEMSRAPAHLVSGPASGSRTGKDFDTLVREYIRLKIRSLKQGIDPVVAETEANRLKPRLEDLKRQLVDSPAGDSKSRSTLEAQIKALAQRLDNLNKAAAHAGEFQKLQATLDDLVADLWEFQRYWDAERQTNESGGMQKLAEASNRFQGKISNEIGQAPTYAAIYTLIGQQLWVANRLLNSAHPGHRRIGLGLALDASRKSRYAAGDYWLAAQVCIGYIWPNVEVANDPNRRSPFNLETLLGECARLFRDNDDYSALVCNWKILLQAARTPRDADQARAQIAMAYEQTGDAQRALQQLRQIQATNDFRWVLRRIPGLERQLQ